MHCYIGGARAGDGSLMRPAFHDGATISGYCQGVEYGGSVEHVFQWIDGNGTAPHIQVHFARIEVVETIAMVHLEVRNWSGKLAGANAHASDVFTLLKQNFGYCFGAEGGGGRLHVGRIGDLGTAAVSQFFSRRERKGSVLSDPVRV